MRQPSFPRDEFLRPPRQENPPFPLPEELS